MSSEPRSGFSQLCPHGADRVELPGVYGPVAALQGPQPTDPAATVLLVPGYTGSKEDFAPLLDGIAEAGLLPVAIDLPGQYESPGPDDESAYGPAQLGKSVAELVTALSAERPVLLLGHSYGGLVARAAVLAGAPVAGLTLLCSGPSALPPGPRYTALSIGEQLLRTQGVEACYALREQLTAQLSPQIPPPPPELARFLRERFVSTSAASLLGMADALRNEPDLVPDLATALREHDIPALVVAGEHDNAWSVPSQRDMAQRLGVEFVAVPGAAHSPNTEAPHALLKELLPRWHAWLRR
ncbi:alpha/beta fold hydrolase [Saccharomonospora viridis]|jgi:pimeloyl-ACP methyl ester carboxylesterase|uniref:Predicted hydrolase or acyltransferase of alpha/beta superfamily n=2 Tax=Saccharomonospora viridis TaxID=1852 RepID=C7MVL5_SACVD|nr:alpha/beta hydrolase [Saccharomonospora viridis]ACU95734.1 predicted hydrolase or acyltransferase of alpha/beta superfamily [Saccharomonospora viridis DSM 43017]KHF43948.1 alpha/beta hydrolase [Saccharomonospora viridis]SFP89095.1 Pimeloyl-ACP methyl ester carboxylesterase [Saccharomonospora viridis]